MILKPDGEFRLGITGSKDISCTFVQLTGGIILSHVFTTANRNDAAVAMIYFRL
jgi:hypothetical protein